MNFAIACSEFNFEYIGWFNSSFLVSEILFKDVGNIDKMKHALDLKYLTEEIKERFRERLMKLGDYSSL